MLLKDVVTSQGLMLHQIRVEDIADRRAWLAEICRDRSVLHLGCCDVPVFDPDNNLHIELSRVTNRIDGLDISAQGIEELRKHVWGDYYTSTEQVAKAYDLALAPEVLEHTGNPRQFLEGLFSINAQSYIVTAPHISWYEKTQRHGDVYVERVHGDHLAWYSPYTLINAIRPFLDEQKDRLRVFLLPEMGSVAVQVTKQALEARWLRVSQTADLNETEALRMLITLIEAGRTGQALFEIDLLRNKKDSPELFYLHAETLLGLGRNMDLFRIAVSYMRREPGDRKCLVFAAQAAEGLHQFDQAEKLRLLAAQIK